MPSRADVAERPVCPPAAEIPLKLDRTRAALAGQEPLVIVAIGSSSTRGAMATDPAHAYPAILQAELARLLPAAHIAVINRGIDGQDVLEQVGRLDRDVLAVRPHLVIWQTGANAAMRGIDPATFRAHLAQGVSMLQHGGADVILMDSQRATRVMAAPRRREIEQATLEAAKESHASLFSRGGLMDAWGRTGHSYDSFIAPDGLHHNDRGYRCVAEALAQSVAAELSRARR